MLRCVVISLSLVAMGSACKSSGGKSSSGEDPVGNVPDSPIAPSADASCPDRQKKVLKESNWDLSGSLEQVLDDLLQKKSTLEPIPVCSS